MPYPDDPTLTIPIFDQEFYPTARDLIHDAKREILLSTYKLDTRPRKHFPQVNLLLSEFISIASLIDTTKVLLNNDSPGRGVSKLNASAATALRAHGIDVYYISNERTSHAKLLIVDQKHLLVGSHNWSAPSLSKNFEVSIYTQHPTTVAQIRAIFLNVIQDAKSF